MKEKKKHGINLKKEMTSQGTQRTKCVNIGSEIHHHIVEKKKSKHPCMHKWSF